MVSTPLAELLPSVAALGSVNVPLAALLTVTRAVSTWPALGSEIVTALNGATCDASVVLTLPEPRDAVIGAATAVALMVLLIAAAWPAVSVMAAVMVVATLWPGAT